MKRWKLKIQNVLFFSSLHFIHYVQWLQLWISGRRYDNWFSHEMGSGLFISKHYYWFLKWRSVVMQKWLASPIVFDCLSRNQISLSLSLSFHKLFQYILYISQYYVVPKFLWCSRFLTLQNSPDINSYFFRCEWKYCWSKKKHPYLMLFAANKKAYRFVFTIYCCNLTERSLYWLRFMAYCNIHWCWNQIITILMKNRIFFSLSIGTQCSSSISIKCCIAKNYQYKIEYLVISMCSQ